MWRPDIPTISRARSIEELRVRAVQLRESAGTGSDARAAEALRRWAEELEAEAHALVIGSWGAP